MQDFLFELLTEELPPKSLNTFISCLKNSISEALKNRQLVHGDIHAYGTPRRLVVFIHQLAEYQPDQKLERFGPNLKAAFDADNKPTKAAIGFAASCGVDITQLQKKNDRLFAERIIPGQSVFELMPEMISNAIKSLPIPKPMRWGDRNSEFVRPAHRALMLYGDQIIPTTILDLKTGNQTQGHRFLSPKTIEIKKPDEYLSLLEKHFVIADFEARKKEIQNQIQSLEKKNQCQIIVEPSLLNEVTAIVEWPVALFCNFPSAYLNLPKEALISSMQSHQKCFPVKNSENQLLPHFVTISNIKSQNENEVIQGNERVMNARLSDAEFFYQTDLKSKLEDRVESLKEILFQKKLGSLYEKSIRLTKLAEYLSPALDVDKQHAKRAALLSKTDLVTQMVGEFPELQGMMGQYYATANEEPESIAIALNEQYMPRFSDDGLPETHLGQLLALVDRIDTIVSIFGINQLPTGTKDPFALRRAALGIIRIMIEKRLTIDLKTVITYSKDLLLEKIANEKTVSQVLTFIKERLKYWLIDQGFSAEEFAAVNANNVDDLLDFYHRIQAVHTFKKLHAAQSLAAANKRVHHILAKQEETFSHLSVDPSLLTEPAEIKLAQLIQEKSESIRSKNYHEILAELALLKEPIDDFFDHVMVMAEDKNIRSNRLIVLTKLRELFLQVADISYLAI